MTVKLLLCVLVNLIVCRAQHELKSSSKTPIRKLTKLLKLNGTEDYPFHHKKCGNLPPTLLTDVLGAAFNSRYMSIDEPKYWEDDIDNHQPNSFSTKRNSALVQPFYVDDTYALEISNKPAWEVKHATEVHYRDVRSIDSTDVGLTRSKRDGRRGSRNVRNERPWNCEAKIKWIDLGPDYFPRFLRSVECTKKKCWYNNYVCKPRSFTVKLLRRRNGECVQINQLNRITNNELPGDLKELWVWEERAVNFCCDCAFP
ncbi:hypothetical protein HA402_002371 [Bradysia odoriphaga]|nr:hypothetical protein HA402_002371 [Bradysia odoriphaga]